MTRSGDDPRRGCAGEKEGRVQTIDLAERTIVLDDGTSSTMARSSGSATALVTDALKEGNLVKLTYEERDGKNVATSVEVK